MRNPAGLEFTNFENKDEGSIKKKTNQIKLLIGSETLYNSIHCVIFPVKF